MTVGIEEWKSEKNLQRRKMTILQQWRRIVELLIVSVGCVELVC